MEKVELTQTIELNFVDAPNREWGPYTPEVSLRDDGTVHLTASAPIRPEDQATLRAIDPHDDRTRGYPLGALCVLCSPGELNDREEIAVADYAGKGSGLPGLAKMGRKPPAPFRAGDG